MCCLLCDRTSEGSRDLAVGLPRSPLPPNNTSSGPRSVPGSRWSCSRSTSPPKALFLPPPQLPPLYAFPSRRPGLALTILYTPHSSQDSLRQWFAILFKQRCCLFAWFPSPIKLYQNLKTAAAADSPTGRAEDHCSGFYPSFFSFP